MRLILRKAKKVVAEPSSSKSSDSSGVKEKTGEQREGRYAARVQIGYEKDGSPQYRYFKTMEEYKTYLQNKNSSKKKKKGDSESKDKDTEKDKDLERKVKKEHKESTKRANNNKDNLFVKKSIPVRLFLGVQ